MVFFYILHRPRERPRSFYRAAAVACDFVSVWVVNTRVLAYRAFRVYMCAGIRLGMCMRIRWFPCLATSAHSFRWGAALHAARAGAVGSQHVLYALYVRNARYDKSF